MWLGLARFGLGSARLTAQSQVVAALDYTITASNTCLIKEFKDGLHEHVKVTDLGKLHWMLGLEIK